MQFKKCFPQSRLENLWLGLGIILQYDRLAVDQAIFDAFERHPVFEGVIGHGSDDHAGKNGDVGHSGDSTDAAFDGAAIEDGGFPGSDAAFGKHGDHAALLQSIQNDPDGGAIRLPSVQRERQHAAQEPA